MRGLQWELIRWRATDGISPAPRWYHPTTHSPHFLMFGERKQKCSQAKNFFDWTNKNVGTIFLLKYLSVSLLYFKHHLECFSWTNVRWAMLPLPVMTSNVWSFPEIDIIPPWHLLHHNAVTTCHSPAASLQICLIGWPDSLTLISARALAVLPIQVDVPQRRDGHPEPRLVILAIKSVPFSESVLKRKLFNFFNKTTCSAMKKTSFLHQHIVKT